MINVHLIKVIITISPAPILVKLDLIMALSDNWSFIFYSRGVCHLAYAAHFNQLDWEKVHFGQANIRPTPKTQLVRKSVRKKLPTAAAAVSKALRAACRAPDKVTPTPLEPLYHPTPPYPPSAPKNPP